MYKQALILATKAYMGKKRYNGNPYLIHPIRVSQEVSTEDQKVIALLHDVVEDTHYILSDLAHFGPAVVAGIEAMTHRKGESYHDYIVRLKKNPDAVAVKIADIADNLKDSPSDHAIEKSSKALEILIS